MHLVCTVAGTVYLLHRGMIIIIIIIIMIMYCSSNCVCTVAVTVYLLHRGKRISEAECTTCAF